MSLIPASDAGSRETADGRSSNVRLLLSGIDSLYVSYDLQMHAGGLDWIELAYQRERLKHARRETFAKMYLGSECFALSPYGSKPYTFILENEAFRVSLGEHIKPGCYVQFYSEALWQDGADRLLNRLDEWCRSLELRAVQQPRVSRVDWAFDYNLPLVDFEPDHFVTRAVKNGSWRAHQQLQSVILGKGDTVIRVYDKVAEIEEQSSKVWFYELWGQKAGVWRVEFQLRRDRLAEAGINNPGDLNDLQGDLLRELVTNHTQLKIPSVTDTNRHRWLLHPLWHELTKDIDALAQTGLVRSIDPKLPLDYRLHQQGRAIYGSLKGIAALLTIRGNNQSPLSFQDILRSLPKVLEQHHAAEASWEQDVQSRVTAYRLRKW